MVAGAVAGQALVQGAGGVVEQLLGPALHQRRLGALRAERGDDRGALAGGDLRWRLPGQVGEVEAASLGGRVGAEAGDVGGQVPALTLVELVGEGRHVGAVDALTEGVEQVVEAQLIHPRLVAQVARRRLQADAGRAVAGTAVAVAHRALLGIQRCAAARVGGDQRRLADLVGRRQPGGELARLTCHGGAVLTLLDRRQHAGHALLQLGALRPCRQGDDQPLQAGEEFQLLTVFAVVDHLAAGHRRRVVGGDVVEQVQGLGGPLQRLGGKPETAGGQQGEQQNGEATRRKRHEQAQMRTDER
ncbi:hypothetical protein FQZ97_777160 [compost metagenome]